MVIKIFAADSQIIEIQICESATKNYFLNNCSSGKPCFSINSLYCLVFFRIKRSLLYSYTLWLMRALGFFCGFGADIFLLLSWGGKIVFSSKAFTLASCSGNQISSLIVARVLLGFSFEDFLGLYFSLLKALRYNSLRVKHPLFAKVKKWHFLTLHLFPPIFFHQAYPFSV